jgi:hypothetical protein
MKTFCTYFDAAYLTRGLALYGSLTRQGTDLTLYVLCLDDVVEAALRQLQLSRVRLVSLAELERANPELSAARVTRSRLEYYFTLTPYLPLHVLWLDPTVEIVTYLDADLFFFSRVDTIYLSLESSSIGLTEHRFLPSHLHRERFGRFNVGWVSFRNDQTGRACLAWWRSRCAEWCFDRVEEGKFADQKYLDEWPAMFPRVAVIDAKGANVAPWNVGRYSLSRSGDAVCVDDEPLIFFHFHGLRELAGGVWRLGLVAYGVRPYEELVDSLYRPYIRELRRWERHLEELAVRVPRATRGFLRLGRLSSIRAALLGDTIVEPTAAPDWPVEGSMSI